MRWTRLGTFAAIVMSCAVVLGAAGCTAPVIADQPTQLPAVSGLSPAASPVIAVQPAATGQATATSQQPPAGGTAASTEAPQATVGQAETPVSVPTAATTEAQATAPLPAAITTPLPATPEAPTSTLEAPAGTAEASTSTPPTATSTSLPAAPSESPAATSAATPQAPSAADVLYQDDFTNPASGWPNELVFQDYYVGYHEPEYYHVEVHTPNDSAIVTVPGRTFDDFSAESRVQISAANTAPNGDFRYGLAIRRSGNRYYAFAISPRTKTWYVLKSVPGNLQVLSQGTQDSIQGLKAMDTLRVNALGPVLTFFVNGQPVSQISDQDYTSGGVGFYVETFDSPKAHIHYDNLVIRRPEASPPAPPPSPTPAPVVACTVQVDLLRLRPGPAGGDGPTIAGLFRSTQLDAFARNTDSSWIRVRIHGADQEGWVSAQPALVLCSGSIASLPENNSLVLQTPTP